MHGRLVGHDGDDKNKVLRRRSITRMLLYQDTYYASHTHTTLI